MRSVKCSGANASENGQPGDWIDWLKLALGLVPLLIAVTQWRARPGDGNEAQMPKCMQAIKTFTPRKAAGLGAPWSAPVPRRS